MRIGLITGEYPPMHGGVGAFTREIAREMVLQSHEVYVLTRQSAKSDSDAGINIEPVIGKTWGWDTLNVAVKWAQCAKLDIINVQFQTAAYDMHPAIHFLPRSLGGIPLIVTFHDLRVPYLFPKAGRLRNWVVRHLAATSAGVIATDRADAAILSDRWGVENVCWIPIGSNIRTEPPADYDRTQWRKSLGINESDLLISYFGFLNESKGALTLIEAVAHLVERGIPAYIIMIGGRAGASDPTDYAYGQRIDAAIEASNLTDRVHWTDFVEEEQVSAHFYASDITALPYLDGVSLRRGTLMAALAHQRAIVTTTSQTHIRELEGALVTVPANDPIKLANAIENLWHDEQRREALKQASGDAAGHFNWDSIVRQTLEFYTSVINR
jgi:glycosyltransferase involved in cell wall biosynthesis